jgi:hypothetical protein
VTLTRRGYRETLATTSPTGLYDLGSATGRHPLAEAVGRLPTLFTGLIGSFHSVLPETFEAGIVEAFTRKVNRAGKATLLAATKMLI